MEKTPGNEINELSKLDTGELVSAMEKYNRNFGMGAMLARQVRDVMESEEGGEVEPRPDEGLLLEKMKANVQPMLDATGLELVPANAGWFILTENESHKGSELRVDIKDGKKFVSYLHSLSPDDVNNSQVAGLENIINTLVKQFQKEYDLTDADDNRMLELLGNLSEIINEYKRIAGENHKNLAESILPFENYLFAMRGGYLREYRQAEKLLLNKPFDGKDFTLRWHIDASPEFLQSRWNEVLDALQSISRNENAADLYGQARATAEGALLAAIRDIESWSEKGGVYGKERRDKFLSILGSVKAKFQEY